MKKKKKPKKTWELHRHGKKWTSQEDGLLRKLYPDAFNHELVERFDRTENAISSRAKTLEIRKRWRKYDSSIAYKHKEWSQKEINRLKELYPVMPMVQLLTYFPKRNANSIHKQAVTLRLRKNYLTRSIRPAVSKAKLLARDRMWSADDIKKLRTLWENGYPKGEIGQILGKTTLSVGGQILRQIRDFGLQRKFKRRLWSPEELKQLKELYPVTSCAQLLEYFPNRNESAIRNRAKLLGLKKTHLIRPNWTQWSNEEIEKLRHLWQQGCTKSKIAKMMGKPQNAVHDQIRKQTETMELQKRFEQKPWLKEETDYLVRHHKDTPDKQLAAALERTIGSVRIRARLLHLTKEDPDRWTAQNISILKKLYPTTSNDELAEKFGRTRQTIAAKARKMGIRKAGYKPDGRVGKRGRIWSKEEDALIRKSYSTAWTKDIAAQLGRTEKSVTNRAMLLGIRKNRESIPPLPNAWSSEDKEKLWQLWQQGYGISQIAEAIGRSAGCVKGQIRNLKRNLGMPKRPVSKPWTAEQVNMLKKHYAKWPIAEIAQKLGKTTTAVKIRASLLGLKKTLN